jgi:thymidylate synthase (FAD)
MKPKAKLISMTRPWSNTGESEFQHALDIIEYSGRVDYGDKSLAKMGDREIIRRWIDSGHQSMIEMADATFSIECSRVVSHELVRHRVASFQQESQRYVKYDEEDPEALFFMPPEIAEDSSAAEIFKDAVENSLRAYKSLRALEVKGQFARYVLPNATRTRIIMKANLREWRHILLLRMHSSAQPEIQEIAKMILSELLPNFPEIFGDIQGIIDAGERQNR